jgi:hypothetical protein
MSLSMFLVLQVCCYTMTYSINKDYWIAAMRTSAMKKGFACGFSIGLAFYFIMITWLEWNTAFYIWITMGYIAQFIGAIVLKQTLTEKG